MAEAIIYDDPLDEPFVDEHKETCRAGVVGLPYYISTKDASALVDVFAMFGVARVEFLTNGYASISFENPESLKRAVASSGKINFRGHFLLLKPKYLKRRYFEYFFNSVGDSIINPKFLDFRGNITQQILSLETTLTYDCKDVIAFPRIANDLEQVMSREWPECRAIMHGSTVTGLHTVMSDADCYMYIPRDLIPLNNFRFTRAEYFFTHRPHIFLDVQVVEGATIPTFKFLHIPTNVYCRVTFKSYLCVCTTRLTKFVFGINKSFRPAALILKYWAQVHGLAGKGMMSSYALMVLFIFYLQQPPSYVPSIYNLQRGNDEFLVDNWNVSFLKNYDTLPIQSNPIWIPDILGGFFAFYANFNFKECVVSPFLGRALMKRDFDDPDSLPEEFEQYKQNITLSLEPQLTSNTPVVVQDLLELNNNIAFELPTSFVRKLQELCKFGVEAYDVGKVNKHKDFLRVILCETPRSLDAYHVNSFKLVEHVYKHFENDVESWRRIFIDHLTMILRDVCQIKLFKLEERHLQNNTRVESSYIGMIEKPIWNRVMAPSFPPDFLEREKHYTSLIMDSPAVVNVDFGLGIWYMEGSNCLNFEISHVMGERRDFVQFGLFFQNQICKWVYACMSSPNTEGSQSDHNKPKR